MAIAAHFEQPEHSLGEPREPRRTLYLEAQGAAASAGATSVLVHNISATGLLLESAAPLRVDEAIEIELPQAGSRKARIVWASGQLFGCAFEAPISPATLSAAQLRSAVGHGVEIAPRNDVPFDEAFGVRLQRLRKARGLTLSQIAGELGVSKPTVWAWEQGKARPVESRIDALAKVLGVAGEELLSGTHATGLKDLLARARDEIARAYGTTRDKVRIMVEL